MSDEGQRIRQRGSGVTKSAVGRRTFDASHPHYDRDQGNENQNGQPHGSKTKPKPIRQIFHELCLTYETRKQFSATGRQCLWSERADDG